MLFMREIDAKGVMFTSETGTFANLNTPEDSRNWELQQKNHEPEHVTSTRDHRLQWHRENNFAQESYPFTETASCSCGPNQAHSSRYGN